MCFKKYNLKILKLFKIKINEYLIKRKASVRGQRMHAKLNKGGKKTFKLKFDEVNVFTAKWRIRLDECFDWAPFPTHHQKTELHFILSPFFFPLYGPFRHIKALVSGAATSELLMSLSTASLCAGSLEPFPTYVLNSPSLKHWLFLGCSKLVSLNWGFDDGAASEWLWPAAFIFLHKYLSIFLFAKSLSLSPGSE